MKAVKFVFSERYEEKPSLTYGKIYDVLNCRINRFDMSIRSIIIKNDFGEGVEYFMNDSFDENLFNFNSLRSQIFGSVCQLNNRITWFEDATSYIRDEKLNKLGI